MVQPSRFRRKDYATLTERSQIQWDGSSIRVRLPTRSVPYHPSDASAKFLGGMTGGISYAMNDDAHTNSFNESLLVEADDQALYIKPLAMQSYGRSSDKLSFQGAAEFLWSLFIASLQHLY